MTTMNVSLPDIMKDWVEAQAQTGHYSNASDHVRDLIRRDQGRAAELVALQRFVDEAEASGTSLRTMVEIIAEARETAKEHGMAEWWLPAHPARLSIER